MATIRKFLFDVSFDDQAGEAEPEIEETVEPEAPPPPTFGEDDLAAARAEGYAQGYATGEQAERTRTERLAAEAVQDLAGRLDGLAQDIGAIGAGAERRAVEFGLAVARKLVPELLRREGQREVEAVVRTALRDMFEDPRIVLRVSDGMLDLIKPRVDAIALESGFDGKVVILSEDGMVDGDCRVEWADGGVERSAARLSAQIETAVTRALAGGAATSRGEPATTTATDTPQRPSGVSHERQGRT